MSDLSTQWGAERNPTKAQKSETLKRLMVAFNKVGISDAAQVATKAQQSETLKRLMVTFNKVGIDDAAQVATMVGRVPSFVYEDIEGELAYDTAINLLTRSLTDDPSKPATLEHAVYAFVGASRSTRLASCRSRA